MYEPRDQRRRILMKKEWRIKEGELVGQRVNIGKRQIYFTNGKRNENVWRHDGDVDQTAAICFRSKSLFWIAHVICRGKQVQHVVPLVGDHRCSSLSNRLPWSRVGGHMVKLLWVCSSSPAHPGRQGGEGEEISAWNKIKIQLHLTNIVLQSPLKQLWSQGNVSSITNTSYTVQPLHKPS